MSDPIKELGLTLKRQRLSLTRPRLQVFEALQGREPQTMHDLVLACQQKVDRASVYRTVALYERLGIVQRLQIGWKYKLELSDAFSQHHHHLTCSNCGQTISLPEDSQLENRLRTLAAGLQFSPQSHQIEIRGYCQTCQAAGSYLNGS